MVFFPKLSVWACNDSPRTITVYGWCLTWSDGLWHYFSGSWVGVADGALWSLDLCCVSSQHRPGPGLRSYCLCGGPQYKTRVILVTWGFINTVHHWSFKESCPSAPQAFKWQPKHFTQDTKLSINILFCSLSVLETFPYYGHCLKPSPTNLAVSLIAVIPPAPSCVSLTFSSPIVRGVQYTFPEELCVTLERTVWSPVLKAWLRITRRQPCLETVMNKVISLERAGNQKPEFGSWGLSPLVPFSQTQLGRKGRGVFFMGNLRNKERLWKCSIYPNNQS